MIANLQGIELDCEERDTSSKQAHNIQESGRNIFRNQNSHVLIARVTPPLYIPILDGAYDMARIGGAQHYLDFVAPVVILIEQQQIESPAASDRALSTKQANIPL